MATKKSKKKAVKKTSKKIARKTTPKKKPTGVYKAKVSVGKAVPNFSLPATGDKVVSLKDLKGKNVVIYFYPKDSTPGCTVEGQDFSELSPKFKRNNTVVFGVSRDSMKSHENFKQKQGYKIDLLSDSEEQLCKIFGVIKMKNMYGRQVRGIERSTFVIGSNGKLLQEWRGVKVPGHAEAVYEFVKSI